MKLIKSKSFILRHPRLSDLKSYYEIETDPISRKMFMGYPKNINEARKDLEKHITDNKKKPCVSETFTIDIKGKFAGYVKLQYQNFDPKGEEGRVHIAIHPDFRGKGLATKAMKAITNYGFKKKKFKRIFAQCKLINKGVAKVNERVGFKLVEIRNVGGIKKMWWVLHNPEINTKYPKNKEHFKKLIPFAKQIIKILRKHKVDPIIYGSFSHFYHTKDANLKVNDIDLLVKNEEYRKLETIMPHEIKAKINTDGGTIMIKKGKLKVEVDRIGEGYKGVRNNDLSKNIFQKIDFYGTNMRIITLKQLESVFLKAVKGINKDQAKIEGKVKLLERFLGRELK